MIVDYHTTHGHKPALARKIRRGKYKVVLLDHPVTARTVAPDEQRYMKPADHDPKGFRRAADTMGATKAALEELRRHGL